MAVKRVNLNLGCGESILDGFINVDIIKPKKADKSFVKASVKKLPFPSEYADYVLMDNVLEHIRMADLPSTLFELRRVMKVGARAVIIVPDFIGISKKFISIYEMGFNPVNYHWTSETIYGNQHHEGEYHKSPMTPEYLNYLLGMVGFSSIKITLYKEGSHFENYPGLVNQENVFLRNDQLVADIIKT